MKKRNKMRTTTWIKVCLLFALPLFMMACEQGLDKYYEVPAWLKGNAKEVLQAKGNYSIFLNAVDRTGYGDMISGKGIITVAAPSDEAFTKWLQTHGYSSIDAVPLEELTKVITFHLVYYSFDKSMFANYQPGGKLYGDEIDLTQAGLYYKFRTKSSNPVTEESDYTVASGADQPLRKIYHKERFLPVLSSCIFQTKGIDAARNYTYFYPNTPWTGADGGFCISNASVTEYAIVADNGYVYTIDQVLEPLETIYTNLKEEPDFSIFFRLYDKFADFYLDPTATANYGNGTDLYIHYHTSLPKIASEWTYNGENATIPDYANFPVLSGTAYNVFAPVNAALTGFFHSFWSGYYSTIDNVNFLPLLYLLHNHAQEGSLVFPEEIEKGLVKTIFGNPIKFDTQNTSLRKLCVNGSLYGLNDLIVPEMYRSVTAPLFQNPKYNAMLQMAHDVGYIIPLASDAVHFTFFIPTDNLVLNHTTVGNSSLYYFPGNINKYGDEAEGMFTEDDLGQPSVRMSRSTENTIVANHIATDKIFDDGQQQIYKTLNSYQYLMVENGKVYCSNSYNNYQDSGNQPAPMKKIQDAYNGAVYEIDGDNSMALIPDPSNFRDQITKNALPEFTGFKGLVTTAGFGTTLPPFDFMLSRYIALVPTNEAIAAGQAAGKIPAGKTPMGQYLKYYFIDVNSSGLNDYLFPGFSVAGTIEVNTFRPTATNDGFARLTVIAAGNSIRIRDGKGNTVNVVKAFPYCYSDGAAYLIDGLLEFE